MIITPPTPRDKYKFYRGMKVIVTCHRTTSKFNQFYLSHDHQITIKDPVCQMVDDFICHCSYTPMCFCLSVGWNNLVLFSYFFITTFDRLIWPSTTVNLQLSCLHQGQWREFVMSLCRSPSLHKLKPCPNRCTEHIFLFIQTNIVLYTYVMYCLSKIYQIWNFGSRTINTPAKF